MNLKLEVLLSASIKQKKPWPRLHWIGQEKEAILLNDEQRLSVLNLNTGRTQSKIPKVQPLLKNVLSVATSASGTWLAGVLTTGELFLWKKDADCLKTVGAVEEVGTLTAAAQESAVKLFLFVTNNGKRVLLLGQTGTAFLWESTEQQDLPDVPGLRLNGQWAQILPSDQARLPQEEDKESAVHAVFVTDEVLGDCCFCSFAFVSSDALVLTTLKLKWFEQVERSVSAVPFCAQWTTEVQALGVLSPACQPVKLRGALLSAFSGDALVLAVVINQNDPKASQVLFVNPMNGVAVSSSLQGCGSSECPVPTNFIRSYWVGGVSWTHDALFLICILKRGSVLLLSRLGELMTLTTFGSSVEFGPAEFIPLHPLITYRQPAPLDADHTRTSGSPTSESDSMRQRFSLAAHPCLPYLIVSDGYMFTVLRFAEHISASTLLKSLLLDVTQGLEDVRNLLVSSEGADPKRWIPPMTSLSRSVLQGWETQDPGTWTPPPFLKDQKSEDDEAEEGDESEDDAPCPSAHSVMDQGHLEFACMFDTLHAKRGGQANQLEAKLGQVQNSLLLAWSLGTSMKEVEGRHLLMQYTVRAILQFARLLPFAPASVPSSVVNVRGKLVSKALRRSSGIFQTLQLLRYCLTVLYWDSVHKHCLAHVVSLSSGIVKLILSGKLGASPSSQSLLSSLLVLKLSSLHLNAVYSLQAENTQLSPDGVSTSLPAADPENKLCNLTLKELPFQTMQTAQAPSHRLAFIWRLLYQHVLQHHSHLRKLQRQSNRGSTRKKLQRELDLLTSVLSQAQAALQTMGERLGTQRKLKPFMGEEHFLLGSYLESVQIWKTAMQEEIGRGGKRLVYLQTRYSLAILYTHLYLYNLSAAQDLCDQLLRHMLSTEQTNVSPGLGIADVAAVAVLQSLSRFMALYFTNQPLYVLPPHHIDVLPPLHFRPGCLPRLVPVDRARVAAAVREQHLSAIWSVERAVELMLIARLLPEAVWVALRLGDWKAAVVLGLAFNLYEKRIPPYARSHWRSLHLTRELHPSQIFQDKLRALLGHAPKTDVALPDLTVAPGANTKLLTDSIEEEDADVMFSSVQEILKAAVMADADVLSGTFDLLMQTVKDLAVQLPGLVPDGLYLPAPPLYCPQPAVLSEGSVEDLGLSRERGTRQKLSGVLQRVLLLLRAARCSLPAARWYIGKLQHSRKVMNKIRKKSGLGPLRPFPNSLLQYGKAQSSFFRPGAGDHGNSDVISVKVVGSFRDLCALCWMFHVREQLSERCRKFQAARDNARSSQDSELAAEYDAAVVDHCLASLEWACRMLPFARFMNMEELVQDIVLSLINELPPIRKVAEIVLRAFPDAEDVRVPLRDKHHTLQQRLRHSVVQGPNGEEMMSVVLHELYRQRMKMLRRLVRNIGPREQHIWERAEEGSREREEEVHDQSSLGTSLSRSTLTDTWRSQTQSEGDTTDSVSVELHDMSKWQGSAWQQAGITDRDTQSSQRGTSGARDDGPEYRESRTSQIDGEIGDNEPQLPLVGSWEFELDDEEYVDFLELFLTYLLERDQVVNEGPNIPLLTSCSEYLREQELNSLTFHVQGTLKRRQGRLRMSEDTFTARSTSSLTSELPQNESVSCGERTKATAFSPVPGTPHSTSRSPAPPAEGSFHSCFPAVITQGRGRTRGLFGSWPQAVSAPQDVSRQWGTLTDSLPAPECQSMTSLLNQDLTPELEARFPDTAKLLEWMVRWSDRRLLYGPHRVEMLPVHSSAIRVRTSVAAILHSLWLLDKSLDIDTSRPNTYKDSEEERATDCVCQPRPRLGRNVGSSGIPKVGCGIDVGRNVEPFQQSDHVETIQVQESGDADHLHDRQDMTSDSDSRTDEEESGVDPVSPAPEQGAKLTVARVDAEDEGEPGLCTSFSPCMSISITPKPRASLRARVMVDAEGAPDEPVRMDPQEKLDRSVSMDPREHGKRVDNPKGADRRGRRSKPKGSRHRKRENKLRSRDPKGQMDKPRGCDPRDRSDKSRGPDPRDQMDKPRGSDPRQRTDEPRDTDPRDRSDNPMGPDPREQTDEPTGIDPRDRSDKPGGSDPRDRMDKPMGPDSRQRTDESTGPDPRDRMGTDPRQRTDESAGTDPRDRMDKPMGPDPREQTDEPRDTDPREWMHKPITEALGQRLNGHKTASSDWVYPSLEQAASGGQSMSGQVTDACKETPVTQATATVLQGTITSDVRHLLHNEMLKLVQLQQMNFMSLLQTVGSSLLQVPGSQPPGSVPSPTLAPAAPCPSTNPPPTEHEAAPGEQGRKQVPMEDSLPLQRPSSLPEERAVHLRSPENLPALPRPEDASVGGGQQLPKVLHTTLPQPLLKSGHGAPWQPIPGPCSSCGLPLLHLQPQGQLRRPPFANPQPREAWAPPTLASQPSIPPHLNSAAYKAGVPSRAEDGGWRESLTRNQGLRAGRSRSLPLHSLYPPQRALPLLRLPQPTHTPLFPLSLAQCLPTQQKLLATPLCYSSRCLEPQVSVLHPPRLVPAQDIIAFEQGRLHRAQQSPGGTQAETFHMLRVNLQPFEPSTQRNGKQRLRRRERQRIEKTVHKAPQPKQSVISPDPPSPPAESRKEPFDDPPEPDPSQCGTVPQGPGVSLLPDQDLASSPFITAAELHCFASTRKNAEERRDASTNTDQGAETLTQTSTAPKSYRDAGILTCSEIEDHPPTATAAPKSYRDAGILACSDIEDHPSTAAAVPQPRTAEPQFQVLPPNIIVNLRFPGEECQESQFLPTSEQTLPGHSFLTIVDIDASELPDLPASAAVTEPPPSAQDEALSIPALHMMAASVTNAAPPGTCPLQESPHAGSVQSSPEDCEQQLAVDELTQKLLQKRSSPAWTPRQASTHGTHQVAAQLSEMELQLSALQDIAISMEQDFANTKMLINTIEHLGCAVDLRGPADHSNSPLTQDSCVTCEPAEEEAVDQCPLREAAGSCGSRCLPLSTQEVAEGWCEAKPATGCCEHWSSSRRTNVEDGGCPRVLAAAAATLGSRGCVGSARLFSRSSLTPQPAHTPVSVLIQEEPRFKVVRGGRDHRSTPLIAAENNRQCAAHSGPMGEMERPPDERLDLSGVSDIIGDLLNEGKLSAEALGLSQGQAQYLSRCSKVAKRSEQERKEIQEWMIRKRRQRLEAYLGNRNELRERERRPYVTKDKRKTFSSREIKEIQKKTAMRKRVTLIENREQRTRAALRLMNEMLSDSAQLFSAQPRARAEGPVRTAERSQGQGQSGSSARGRGAASRSMSASGTRRSLSSTFSMGRACPVSSPGRGHQPDGPTLQDHLPAEDQSDSDSLSPWSPPEYIQDILDRETHLFLQGGDEEERLPGAEPDLCEVQSDTTDTILCNLDWNVVNNMVGGMGEL
ncbi:ciliogenesis and planar polarity effector 1 isoform X1 [Mobula hypostoma]|uniref:ciliogenesis and planar polarity effector 1 isoform X1 n=1 Tax=Mobula hypostoma TaxID=723540 RepID=UPI002FC3DD1B